MYEEFDYVIVGAGSAGAPLAARLSEDPHVRVLLLEAGSKSGGQNSRIPAAFSKLFKSKYDWDYVTDPQPGLGGRSVYWPRGKMLGGCSSMNAMMWVRGFAVDFEYWAQVAGEGWGWENAQAYFRRIEDGERPGPYLASGGAQAISSQRSPSPLTEEFLTACLEAGLPRSAPEEVNGPAPEGFTHALLTQRHGVRFGTADAYLTPARRRSNLTVRTDAQAQRVLITSGRATGVRYRHKGSDRTASAAREVVLCGGAVNSPQLLMLSGIGPAGHLREHGIETVVDAPEVGSNLQDHLFAPVVVGCDGSPTLFRAESPSQLLRFLLRRRGMLTSNVAEAYGFTRSSDTQSVADLELLFAPAPFVGEGLSKPAGDGVTAGPVLLQPASTGTITLRSPDPFRAPRINPRYLSDSDGVDRAALLSGLDITERLLSTPPLSRRLTGCMQPTKLTGRERAEAVLRYYAHTLYHPSSTCRMGGDERSVVDPELRVRGIDGLRVADASIMPRIVHGHTNAACLMIGERAADLVAGGEAVDVAPGTGKAAGA